MSGIEQGLKNSHSANQATETKQKLHCLIQKDQYVGDIYSINYDTAKVIIHDYYRKQVGGIPSLSFLIATRINPDSEKIDFKEEDSSIILLRVMDSAMLPQDKEAERIRVETAQQISGETGRHWDGSDSMDAKTKVLLSYAGLECRIIGTFFLSSQDENDPESVLNLAFGSDISNYYPNQGLKVYKPNAEALERIVNFIDASNLQLHVERYGNTSKVKLGHIRYFPSRSYPSPA